MRYALVCLLLLIIACSEPAIQDIGEVSAESLLLTDSVSARKGERCYALSIEAWDPPIAPEADTIFHQPPEWFGLTTQRHTDVPGYEVRPTIVINHRIRQEGTWLQRGPDNLVVRWGDGFTGVFIEFEARVDTLLGVAQIITDMGNAPYARATAGARAVPRPCPPPEEAEELRGTSV